jgi:hypothetical protein
MYPLIQRCDIATIQRGELPTEPRPAGSEWYAAHPGIRLDRRTSHIQAPGMANAPQSTTVSTTRDPKVRTRTGLVYQHMHD